MSETNSNRQNDLLSASVSKSAADASLYPLQTREEEDELMRRIHGGGTPGEEARELLVRSNLRYVVAVAKRYKVADDVLTSLIEAGITGLNKAIDHYDETQSYRFISYAIWWIRQSVLQYATRNLPSK